MLPLTPGLSVRPNGGRADPVGELVASYPVAVVSAGLLEDNGTFVFVATPSHIAGCAIDTSKTGYEVVAGSFAKLDERSFRLKLATISSSMVDRYDEERVVLCTLDPDEGLVHRPRSFFA